MKSKLFIVLVLALLLLAAVSCDKKKSTNNNDTTASEALSNYWVTQTDLTTVLAARDSTMLQITNHIEALYTSKSGKDGYTEIEDLMNLYVNQSEQSATQFDKLITLENAIVPYGYQDKGIFTSIAKGIYTKAKNTVVSSGQMVRSSWRVLSGQQTIRQVVNDPNSGIPFLSGIAEKLQQENAARDAAIREEILANNSEEGMIPIDELPGLTMQEKANAYLNLPDDSPLKMQTRRLVMNWDPDSVQRTAALANELGKTAVNTVGDAYGGPQGEWVNEVINQHLEEGQDAGNTGTCNLNVNEDNGTTNPAILGNKTIIISKNNMPDEDPRITVIMNAPQNLIQPLPTGEYSIIVLADGFIRSTVENLAIVQSQTQNLMAKLLKLADNAIVIETMTADPETVFLGETATINVSCVSTIGKSLDFTWEVTGGTFTNKTSSPAQLKFKPTQEGTFTITVTVEDALGNSKTRSVEVRVIDAQLSVGQYTIVSENFTDNLINPGEQVTINLLVTNNGTEDVTGMVRFEGTNGITVDYDVTATTLLPGENTITGIIIQLPVNYTEIDGAVNFCFDTFDANLNPVTISSPVLFPVDFYVEINPVTSPVTDRVLIVSGRVANPMLTTAMMFLDNDYEQPTTLNLNNGNFSQQIALSGSTTEVQHSVKIVAYSGGNVADASLDFSSLVPVTALRMTLSWDTPGTDVDFWCTDPNGEKCYYGNTTTASGLELDFDDTNGYGPENITTTTIIPGDYLVQAHYYSDHDSNNAIYSNCQVVIRQNEGTADETINNYYGGLSDTGDVWTVTTLTYAKGKWTVKPTNKHSWVNPNTLPAK